MKKNCFPCFIAKLLQTLVTNKLFTIAGLLFFLLQTASAQDFGLNKLISLNLKNKSISDVVKEISEKSGVHFSYSSQQIPVDRKVSIRAVDKPVKEILEQLLKSNGIDFVVVEKQIILKPSHKAACFILDILLCSNNFTWTMGLYFRPCFQKYKKWEWLPHSILVFLTPPANRER